MMSLVVFILTFVGVIEGGGPRSTCPAPCRCESVGMLQSVDCADAGLRSVPSNMGSFTSSLDLSMNQLAALSAHVFTDLHSLQELRLAGNSLSEIEKDAFTGLTGLRLLNLQNNHLKTVPPETLKNLKNLRSLHLDANFISHLPATSFRGLASLHHLWLDDNILMEVPVLALNSLTKLQALTLALNHISSIPDRAFAALSQLLVLHLHDNLIHSLGQRSFTGLNELESLDLSFNKINRFPAAIRSLISLRVLNLQNNNIPVIPENAFAGNPSIETIHIQNNPLHTVGQSSFRLLPELRTLSLSSGSIAEFPDFTGTNKLETLNLHHNFIREVKPGASDQVEDLGSVDLSSVSMEGLKPPGHLQLRVSGKHQHTLRPSELQCDFRSCAFLHWSVGLQDTGLPMHCLDLLHFIFIASIIFNLLVLLSILLLPSAPTPPSSRRLTSILFWFRLLAGLSGSISTDWFCGSDRENDPGSVVFLFTLSSEVCVFIVMAAVLEGKTRKNSCFQISCVVCCSLALTLTVFPLVVEERNLCSLCEHSVCLTYSSALVLFNTFCYLFMILTHITCRHGQDGVTLNLRPDCEHIQTVSLTIHLANTILFVSASLLLGLSSLLSPDFAACAALVILSLPCCADPLLYMILRVSQELHSFLQQTPEELKTEEKSERVSV